MEAREGGPRRSVFLVDETPSLADFAADTLAAAGYDIIEVDTAGDCLARLEAEDPAGIVSVATLPDLDGLQLLRSLRVSYPTVPFVLAPADGSETLAGDALAAGASGYVPRSDGPERILERLERGARRGGTEDEEDQRYRHLIEMSPAPINVFDESGDSIWCNPALVEMFGLETRQEFLGTSIFEFIHPDDHELARRELASVVDGKESTGPTDMRIQTPAGIRYIRVSTAIGEFLGADIGQAIALDVTDREERDRQLKVLDQWLRHNIRNEMNVIQGIAADIQTGRVDDVEASAAEIASHVDRLLAQTEHERELIDLLSSGPEQTRTTVDLETAVQTAVAAAREAHPEAHIETEITAQSSIQAVPKIRLAIQELLENAITHNDRPEPAVEVGLHRDPEAGAMTLRVADDGPGIPATERESLTLEREIDDLNHGSGLGLVLVYWTVRLSGGSIDFAENEPRGSVITCSFPAG